jgi:hypothetical protein
VLASTTSKKRSSVLSIKIPHRDVRGTESLRNRRLIGIFTEAILDPVGSSDGLFVAVSLYLGEDGVQLLPNGLWPPRVRHANAQINQRLNYEVRKYP